MRNFVCVSYDVSCCVNCKDAFVEDERTDDWTCYDKEGVEYCCCYYIPIPMTVKEFGIKATVTNKSRLITLLVKRAISYEVRASKVFNSDSYMKECDRFGDDAAYERLEKLYEKAEMCLEEAHCLKRRCVR